MNRPELAALVFLLGIGMMVVGYDLVAPDTKATLSGILFRWGQRWPMVPYVVAWGMGALFGHWFL